MTGQRRKADPRERIDAVFAPLTRLGLDAAGPRPDERVLDIGRGRGDTVLALAGAAGPGGRVCSLVHRPPQDNPWFRM